MLFPSEATARRFATFLRKADTKKPVESVAFYLPDSVSLEHALWGGFVAVFYHPDLFSPGAQVLVYIGRWHIQQTWRILLRTD